MSVRVLDDPRLLAVVFVRRHDQLVLPLDSFVCQDNLASLCSLHQRLDEADAVLAWRQSDVRLVPLLSDVVVCFEEQLIVEVNLNKEYSIDFFLDPFYQTLLVAEVVGIPSRIMRVHRVYDPSIRKENAVRALFDKDQAVILDFLASLIRTTKSHLLHLEVVAMLVVKHVRELVGVQQVEDVLVPRLLDEVHGAVNAHVVYDEILEMVTIAVDQVFGEDVVLGEVEAAEVVLVGGEHLEQEALGVVLLQLAVGHADRVQQAAVLDAAAKVVEELRGVADVALFRDAYVIEY